MSVCAWINCTNLNEYRKSQCLSLPFDPTIHSNSSYANQSFPYLPMSNVDDHTDLTRQMNAVALIHANSLGDLKAIAMDFHEMPSSRVAVSNVPSSYARPPSPRLFQRQMSFSEDDISFIHSDGIGWNIPQTVNAIDPLLRVQSRAKIASLKALKNIPLSLKAFKSSVPIQSQRAHPLNRVPVVDERIVQSIQMQARKSRSLKHLFNKAHSLNPAENRSMVFDKPRKNSIPYTGRNASNIIRRKMNHENQQHFDRHSDRNERDKKSVSLDLSLLGYDVDGIPNEMDPDNDSDADGKSKMLGIRRFSRRSSGRRTKAKQFFRDSKEANAKSEHIFELVNAFSDDDLRIENRSFDDGSDDVFESPKQKATSEHSSKTMPITDKSVQQSNDTKSTNKQLTNKPTESPNHRRSSVVKPVAHDSRCRDPIIANQALNNSSPKPSKPRDVPNESQPNKNMPLKNSEYDVQDRGGASAHSSRASGKHVDFAADQFRVRGQSKTERYFDMNSTGHRLSGGQHSLAGVSRDQVERGPSRSLSDRDAREQNDSFNRSLSNAEGTPDDKIGRFY